MAIKVSDLANEVYQAVLDWRRGSLLRVKIDGPIPGSRSFYVTDEHGEQFRISVKPINEKSLARARDDY